MTPPWASYVAIGDSFTEGLRDPRGEDTENLRGWADRLATTMSRRRIEAGEPALRYANLAIRGRRLNRIMSEQLPPALAMQPDLISIVGGGIDVLRLGADPDRLAEMLEEAVVRARAAGCDVLLATCMDTRSGGPLLGSIRPRMALYSAHIFAIARRHGCYVMDQWGLSALQDLRMWSQDRIHLSAEGHHRLSQSALVGLGLEPDDPDWQGPSPRSRGGHRRRPAAGAPGLAPARRGALGGSWHPRHLDGRPAFPQAARAGRGHPRRGGRRGLGPHDVQHEHHVGVPPLPHGRCERERPVVLDLAVSGERARDRVHPPHPQPLARQHTAA